jgi:2-amino-4-hydroxy-6-hydroxymethyldihydropteridine diphosphokinase
MAQVYVSIGSNVEPIRHVRSALAALEARFGRLVISPAYESRAVGFAGANFMNLVVGFDSAEPPAAIAEALKGIEAANGRVRGGPRFADRTLDLDLILYGSQVVREQSVSVPRDEILEHAHVLRPLSDIAGGERHPLVGLTYRELWEAFGAGQEQLWPATLGAAAGP